MTVNFNGQRGAVLVGVLALLMSLGAVVYSAGVNGNRITNNAARLDELIAWRVTHEAWSRDQMIKITQDLEYIKATLNYLKQRQR